MNEENAMPKLILVGLLLSLSVVAWRYGSQAQSGMQSVEQSTLPQPTIAWRRATDAEKQAATQSIKAQLDAFKKDDFHAAARYQSVELKSNFASVKNFREMMKSSYPQFCRYKSAQFGNARAAENGRLVQIPVELTGMDGKKVSAEYSMVKEKDGNYRVRGVAGGQVAPSSCPSHQHDDSETPQSEFPPPVKDESKSETPGAQI